MEKIKRRPQPFLFFVVLLLSIYEVVCTYGSNLWPKGFCEEVENIWSKDEVEEKRV